MTFDKQVIGCLVVLTFFNRIEHLSILNRLFLLVAMVLGSHFYVKMSKRADRVELAGISAGEFLKGVFQKKEKK